MQSANRAFVIGAITALCAAIGHAQPAAPQSSASAPVTAAAATPQRPGSMVSSILTVEELLRLENAFAMKQAHKQRAEAGLAGPEVAVKSAGRPAAPPMTASVDAIFGTNDNLRAHIVVDGQTFQNVGAGSPVKECEIERIANHCVIFRSVPVRAGSRVAGPLCPTACWTGIKAPPATLFGTGGPLPAMPGGMPGGPLPSPMSQAQPPALQASVRPMVINQPSPAAVPALAAQPDPYPSR
jgi:hypothetical protein